MKYKTKSNSKLSKQKRGRFSETSQIHIYAFATAIAVVVIYFYTAFTEKEPHSSVQTVKEPVLTVPEQNDSFTKSVPHSTITPILSSSTPIYVPVYPQNSQELAYNIINPSRFIPSQKLQEVVDDVVKLAKGEQLPPQSLSITLIDVNSGEVASYQENELRYPASIAKLFWMTVLYSRLETNTDQNQENIDKDLKQMIRESNNDAASRILDRITETESGSQLDIEEFQDWLNKRQFVNRYFQIAGYGGIDISQKTFPILYLKLDEPKGRDLQMRGIPVKPLRNKMTTQQAARLIYEIVTRQAISDSASEQMERLLLRDLQPKAWQHIDPNMGDFNPVRAFFGEYLPKDTYFVSKAGWTNDSRQEVAFIRTSDDKSAYILAIFADSRDYAQHWTIFPKMSRLVYNRMTVNNN